MGFFYSVMIIYALHAILDVLCTLVTILDPFYYAWRVNNMNIGNQEVTADKLEKEKQNDIILNPTVSSEKDIFIASDVIDDGNSTYPKYYKNIQKYWDFFLNLYPSLFKPDMHNNPTQNRMLIYCIASMSLTRVICVLYMNTSSALSVSCAYFFEFLLFQYEGYTAQTILVEKARIMSFFALIMGMLSIIVCLWT
jgi:hypothetical protein